MRLPRHSLFAPFLIVCLLSAGCTPEPGSPPSAPVKTSGTGQPVNTEGSGTTQRAKTEDPAATPPAKGR